MKNTEWITALQSVLGVEENIDYQNYTLVLIKIFQGVIYPEVIIIDYFSSRTIT